MISATAGIHDLAKEATADGALEKPFKMQELKEIVDRFL
jgi:hypothetical protein